ncbi:MAG TPA: DUF1028 domain-containing protein [Stellaceae bacterium]|nr:DUF1028 domain-containing protein [Stellaceae bacterium]
MTFSIAGLCRRTGEFGCALTTSSMAVGGRAAFVVPEVGVVLSQARSDPRLGALGVKSLEAGRSARQVLAEMIASTPHAEWRQLAVLDLNGGVADFTGAHCTLAKGARPGRDAIALGNGLANDAVVGAMMEGFAAAPDGALADRLLSALDYGLAAGGEAFPLRSAALKVARPGVPFPPIDLRVDYSETPVADLRRIWEAWEPMIAGYVERCLDPANSPAAATIEGHAPIPA